MHRHRDPEPLLLLGACKWLVCLQCWGPMGLGQEGGCEEGARTWGKAFFPTGRTLRPFVSRCPMAKLMLAEEFWLVGVAGARNYLPGKNPIPRIPG